jgi:hypothetical protein
MLTNEATPRLADSELCPKCGAATKCRRTHTRTELTGAMETEWCCGSWVEFDTPHLGELPFDIPFVGRFHQLAQCKLNQLVAHLRKHAHPGCEPGKHSLAAECLRMIEPLTQE